MEKKKETKQTTDIILFDVAEELKTGINNIQLEASETQLNDLTDKQVQLTQLTAILTAEEDALKKKQAKLNEYAEKLNLYEDRRLVRELRNKRDTVATEYNAKLESILSGFQHGKTLNEKLRIISKLIKPRRL